MNPIEYIYLLLIGQRKINYEDHSNVRLLFSNIYSLIASVIILGYGVANLLEGFILTAFLEIVSGVILFILFLFGRFSREFDMFIWIKIGVVIALMLYAFLTGGSQGTGFLWIYAFPVAIFAISSSFIGLFSTLFFFSLLGLFYFFNILGFLQLPYEREEIKTFFLSVSVVTLIVYIYKVLQENSFSALDAQRKQLEIAKLNFDAELTQKKDTEKELEESLSKLKEQNELLNNTKTAMLNLLEDVNKEKQKSQEQAADLKKFEETVENASDHIVFTDVEGKILYANSAVSKTTGYDRKDIIGKTPRLWGGQMSPDFYKEFWNTIKVKKQTYKGELTNRRKNGELYTAEVQAFPVLDESGQVKFFVGIERDITKAKEVDKLKSEFVSVASHQLRTPATGVKWYAELILEGKAGKLTKKQKEYITEMYQSNERMLALINDLLNVSRIETGSKFEIQFSSVDIIDLVKNMVQEINKLASEKDVKVIMVKPQIKKLLVEIDKEKIFQVIKNLIDNGVKYSPSKSKVMVEVQDNQDQFIISVKDTGIGIPKDQSERIFEKFFRADNVLKAETDGTGLGLYIVKAIVEGHYGKVWFESNEDKGTTFFVSLPKKHISKENRVIQA
ncbi:PAS domain S-box protein [Candidatus Dojkabacteria bacterium]|uniref:histidine kinase n=1 Tax=Candidatus Dojkabacteria bacterium TaxID=2099670 RepID=A0A955L9U5_9BACT|nr:PAS domain S-box protein [Candidatus Dojkabacteria bacterium]